MRGAGAGTWHGRVVACMTPWTAMLGSLVNIWDGHRLHHSALTSVFIILCVCQRACLGCISSVGNTCVCNAAQEEDEEEHRDGDDNESDYNRGHNNMDSTSSSDSASGAAGGGDQGVKTGGDRVLRAAAHSGEDGVIGVAGSGGPPPTVAVGLSWVVGAMVVETMHSRYGDHPGFLFEGGLGEFEHGVQVWLKHHVAMMLLAGGGLALMLLWRGWRTLTVLRRGTRGLVGFGKGDGGSYVGKQAEEVRVL
eukprot:767132-Pelagomonas_calceolata.AAC.1